MTNKVFTQTLKNRSFICVSGEDRYEFLQGLITNDIYKLKEQPLIYSWFLSPQGKYMHDFFIFEKDKQLFIDCQKSQQESLFKKLRLYKLRSKVTLSFFDDVITVLSLETKEQFIDESYIALDPRHVDMGWRLYIFGNEIQENFDKLEVPYEAKRYHLGIAEGDNEIIMNKSTLLEYRMDVFNAVDFDKGCYIGQELTARIHYRGLLKKEIVPFSITAKAVFEGKDIMLGDKNVGEVRGYDSSTGHGIALMKKEYITEAGHMLNDVPLVILMTM